jgi:hypothetical protein
MKFILVVVLIVSFPFLWLWSIRMANGHSYSRFCRLLRGAPLLALSMSDLLAASMSAMIEFAQQAAGDRLTMDVVSAAAVDSESTQPKRRDAIF